MIVKTPQIPLELWSRVCYYLGQGDRPAIDEEPGPARPPTRDLAVMMRVSKTMYRAAAPQLYKKPYVTDPSSWLRGVMKGFPHLPSTDEELVAMGNMKLPILRYTKHLVLLSEHYRPEVDGTDGVRASRSVDDFSIEEQDRVIEDGIKRSARLDDATDALTSIMSNHFTAFGQLQVIQVGERDWMEHHFMAPWVLQEQGAAGCLLMRKLKPPYWCQFNTGGIWMHPSTRPVEFRRDLLPRAFTAHAHIGQEFVVLWGTENRIYVTDSASSGSKRLGMGMGGMIGWVVENILGSYPEDLGSALQTKCQFKSLFEKKTSFVIYNLPPPDLFTGDATASKNVYHEWNDAVLRKLVSDSGRSWDHWNKLLKVEELRDDGICPNCLNGCR